MNTTQVGAKHSIFLTILSWMFAALFVLSTVGVIFSFFPIGKLLDPGFYQQVLQRENIYQRLPESIAAQLANTISSPISSSKAEVPLIALDQQEWESILLELIDPAWLQSQSESALDQVFEILLVSPDPLNTPIVISVEDIKQRLAGPEGTQAIQQIIEAQPPCSVDQLLGVLQAGLGMETSINSLLCRPPDFILSELDPFVEAFLDSTAGQIPDQIQFYLPLPEPQTRVSEVAHNPTPEIPETLKTLRLVNSLVTWSPLLPVTLLLILTLLAVRSLRDFMTWWGGTFFTAGIISLIFSFLIFPTMNWTFAALLPISLSDLISIPELLGQLGMAGIFQGMVNQLLLSIRIPAGILSTIGFALLLGVFLLNRNTANLQIRLADSSDLPTQTRND
ncbi:MAG: hypothetical protein ACK2UE_18065 [Anaerolineales bacterium]